MYAHISYPATALNNNVVGAAHTQRNDRDTSLAKTKQS